MSIYEKLIPYKKIPYGLFWFVLGIAIYGIGEIALSRLGESPFIIQVLYVSISIACWPTVFIWLSKSFQQVMRRISQLMWDNQGEFEQWLLERTKRIFTFESTYPRITSLIFGLGVPITLLWLGIPVNHTITKILALIGLGVVSFIGGHYAYVWVDLMVTLGELSKRDIQIPFFRLPNPNIADLQGFYSAITVFMVLSYSSLVIAVWQSPYGLNSLLLVWLSVLGVFPLAMFLWTIFTTHQIVKRAKQAHIDIVNEQIQVVLKNAIANRDEKVYQQLDKIMDIQTKVQSTRDWPISFAETLTFLLTIVATIVQLTVSIINVFKP